MGNVVYARLSAQQVRSAGSGYLLEHGVGELLDSGWQGDGASNVDPAPEIRTALAAAPLAVTDTGCELPADVDVQAVSATASSAREPAAGMSTLWRGLRDRGSGSRCGIVAVLRWQGYRGWTWRVQAWAPIWIASHGLPSGGV